MLNVNTKYLSKVFAEKLKKCLPFFLSPNQITFVKDRFISDGERLISDILTYYEYFKIKRLISDS